MPVALTAEKMVRMCRDQLQVFSNYILRDGFPDDPPDDDGNAFTSTSILDYLNESQRQLLMLTGYAKCREQIAIVAGVWEYLIDPQSGKFVDVTINGNALDRTTIGREDLLNPGWQNTTTQVRGTPTKYYTLADVIGFIPTPDTAYTALAFVDTLTADLVNQDDVPGRIPVLYQHGLVARAALDLNDMVEIENQMSTKRVTILQKEWDTTVTEVMKIVNGRGDDSQETIVVADPRSFWFMSSG